VNSFPPPTSHERLYFPSFVRSIRLSSSCLPVCLCRPFCRPLEYFLKSPMFRLNPGLLSVMQCRDDVVEERESQGNTHRFWSCQTKGVMCHAGHARFMWSHEPLLRRLLRHLKGWPHLVSRAEPIGRCGVPCRWTHVCVVRGAESQIFCGGCVVMEDGLGRAGGRRGRGEPMRRSVAAGTRHKVSNIKEEGSRILHDGRSSWLSGSRSVINSGPICTGPTHLTGIRWLN
jgi:hypothetical protein